MPARPTLFIRWLLRDGSYLSLTDRLAEAVARLRAHGEIEILLSIDGPEALARRLLPAELWPTVVAEDKEGWVTPSSIIGGSLSADDPETVVRLLEARAHTSGVAGVAEHTQPRVRPQFAPTPLTTSRIEREGLAPGTPAPHFSLPACDGSGLLGPGHFSGRDLILIFTDPNCGPCNAMLASLATHLSKTPPPEAVAMLLVGRGDFEANAAHLNRLAGGIPAVVQRGWELSREFGIFATPVAFWIDPGGVIARPVARGAAEVLTVIEMASSPQEARR